jgi:hypothetical protein
MTSEPPENVLILTHNIDLVWDCPLKPRVSNSFSAFRSGISAPFLGKYKYICGRFGVSVGTMDSRGLSEDIFRRVGWNYGALDKYLTEITRNKNARHNKTEST